MPRGVFECADAMGEYPLCEPLKAVSINITCDDSLEPVKLTAAVVPRCGGSS